MTPEGAVPVYECPQGAVKQNPGETQVQMVDTIPAWF